MKLCAKVVVATQQWPAIMWASTPMTNVCLNAMLFKFATSEDHQAVL